MEIEFEHDGKKYKGIALPDSQSAINGIPMKFIVQFQNDKESFDIMCTPEGWVSEDPAVNPNIIEAVGEFLMSYYG